MGFDCGFDIYPRLEATASNKETYRRFLDEIIRTYENVYDKEGQMTDGKVLDIPPNSHHSDKIYIRFMVGECPHMPGNPDRCDYFLRFSSKVSGRLTTPAAPYIRSVYKIAKKYFGSRVHFWHEMAETGDERQRGYYNWQEVHDADKKLRELETGQEQDLQNRSLEERGGEINDEPNLSSVTLPTRANLIKSAHDVDLPLRSQPGATEAYEQPDKPEMSTTIAGYVSGSDPIKELNVALFEIQSVAGKGKGLVARFDIAKGTRILYEKPLFTTPKLSPISLMESSIASKIKSLSKTEQRQFLSLHNNFPGKHPFSGIVRTNALPLGPDSVIGGIFPTICRINHSCLPNAQHNWNSDTECETIHAVCNIKPGEEITISYDKGGPSDSRRAHLKDNFGFDCNCSLCSLPTPELLISDARRRKIQLLDEAIGDPGRVMDKPNECIADCHSLLLLLEEEYKGSAYAGIARLYYDAFQISITHGDQARASAFAAKAYKSRVICEGEDSPLARKMKGLMADPEGHRNFGISMRWRTAKALVPKGLDVTGFEKWLWRRGQ